MQLRSGNSTSRSVIKLVFALSALLVCSLGTVVSSLRAQDVHSTLDTAMKLDILHKEYSGLEKDWRKQREFCVTLIDNNVMRIGAERSSIQRIFGKDVVFRQVDQNQVIAALIHFENQVVDTPTELQKPVQRPYTGWYLYIEVDSNEKVAKYFLSNAHRLK